MIQGRKSVHCRLPYRSSWLYTSLKGCWQSNERRLRWFWGVDLSIRSNGRSECHWGYPSLNRFCLLLFARRRRCSNCIPELREGYFEAHLHDFFADHAVDIDLWGLWGSDVIEDEDIFLVIGLNDQLILAIRKVDAPRQPGLCLLRLQSDHHLHLLLSI